MYIYTYIHTHIFVDFYKCCSKWSSCKFTRRWLGLT